MGTKPSHSNRPRRSQRNQRNQGPRKPKSNSHRSRPKNGGSSRSRAYHKGASRNHSKPVSSRRDLERLQVNTAANLVTLLRILFFPFIVLLLSPVWSAKLGLSEIEASWTAAGLFILASITDGLDGYLARKNNKVTIVGQFLDPLADKLIVVSALLMLVTLGRIHAFLALALILREMAVTGLRGIASAEGMVMPANFVAKLKTVSQMIAIPLLMIGSTPAFFENSMGLSFVQLGTLVLWVSLLFSLWSGTGYVIQFFSELKKKAIRDTEMKKRAQKREEHKKQSKSTRPSPGSSSKSPDSHQSDDPRQKERGSGRGQGRDSRKSARGRSPSENHEEIAKSIQDEEKKWRKERERVSQLSLTEHRQHLRKEAERRSGQNFKAETKEAEQTRPYEGDREDPRTHMKRISGRNAPPMIRDHLAAAASSSGSEDLRIDESYENESKDGGKHQQQPSSEQSFKA